MMGQSLWPTLFTRLQSSQTMLVWPMTMGRASPVFSLTIAEAILRVLNFAVGTFFPLCFSPSVCVCFPSNFAASLWHYCIGFICIRYHCSFLLVCFDVKHLSHSMARNCSCGGLAVLDLSLPPWCLVGAAQPLTDVSIDPCPAGVPVSSRVSAKIQQLVNTLKRPKRPPLREFFVDDFEELLEGKMTVFQKVWGLLMKTL